MTTVLVVEDDPAIRRLVSLHLESATYDVITAEDGMEGLSLAIDSMPDLIVSDYQMPNVDGIGMLAAIRANSKTQSIPVIFLTASDDVKVRARCTELGASDYLVKPFNRSRLLQVVAQQVQISAGQRLEDAAQAQLQPTSLHLETIELAPMAPSDPFDEDLPPEIEPDRTLDGTVMFFAIKDFGTITEALEEDQQVALIGEFYESLASIVVKNAGWIVKFSDGCIIAMFEGKDAAGALHAERALKAALLGVVGMQRLSQALATRVGPGSFPGLVATVGVHAGTVSLCQLGGGRRGERTIIGDAVNVTSRLQARAGELGWSVVCSQDALRVAGPRFAFHRHGQVAVKGRSIPLDIVEVTALLPKNAGDPIEGIYSEVAAAIEANTQCMAAQHVSALAGVSRSGFGIADDVSADAPILIEGYRLLRKIGEGGVAQVFLAAPAESDEPHVLKIVRMTEEDDGDLIQRFIQEYALLSQIDHPNVARIFKQGFAGAHAYISMEYFPGGDLRGMMRSVQTPELAIAALIQVAGGLGAVHDVGIVHRDLKPDNIMIRADGTLAIADFGIAKHVTENFGATQHGEVVGTPYYLSPEQAMGKQVDQRADIYCLGVMLYEMLSGQRAYTSDTAMGLLQQHVQAPVPQLPSHLQQYQPLVDRMMCKKLDGRFANTGQIIDFLLASNLA